MEIYLPIVEVQINVILVLFVSFIIGFLSGLFANDHTFKQKKQTN